MTTGENDKLALMLMRHADDLQLYINGLEEDAIADFERTADAIMELVYKVYAKYGEKGIPQNRQAHAYLEDIKTQINEIRAYVIEEELEDELNSITKDIIEHENAFWKTFFTLAGVSVVFSLSKSFQKQIQLYGLYNGAVVKDILHTVAVGDTERIHRALVNGLQKGGSLEDVRNAVRHEMNTTNRFVRTEINSIVNGVINDITKGIAFENKSKIMYSAVLDANVCTPCRNFHGRIFDYDDNALPALPRHNNCRCQFVAVPGTISAAPSLLMSFNSYISGLSKAEQLERLGTDKFDLWQAGKYKLQKYETALPGQRISLEDMSKRQQEIMTT